MKKQTKFIQERVGFIQAFSIDSSTSRFEIKGIKMPGIEKLAQMMHTPISAITEALKQSASNTNPSNLHGEEPAKSEISTAGIPVSKLFGGQGKLNQMKFVDSRQFNKMQSSSLLFVPRYQASYTTPPFSQEQEKQIEALYKQLQKKLPKIERREVEMAYYQAVSKGDPIQINARILSKEERQAILERREKYLKPFMTASLQGARSTKEDPSYRVLLLNEFVPYLKEPNKENPFELYTKILSGQCEPEEQKELSEHTEKYFADLARNIVQEKKISQKMKADPSIGLTKNIRENDYAPAFILPSGTINKGMPPSIRAAFVRFFVEQLQAALKATEQWDENHKIVVGVPIDPCCKKEDFEKFAQEISAIAKELNFKCEFFADSAGPKNKEVDHFLIHENVKKLQSMGYEVRATLDPTNWVSPSQQLLTAAIGEELKGGKFIPLTNLGKTAAEINAAKAALLLQGGENILDINFEEFDPLQVLSEDELSYLEEQIEKMAQIRREVMEEHSKNKSENRSQYVA